MKELQFENARKTVRKINVQVSNYNAQYNYAYEVTRVHANEKHLLKQKDIEELISAKNVDEVIRILKEKGWGNAQVIGSNKEAIIDEELNNAWQLVQELCGNLQEFTIFRVASDFHNLKAAIKLVYTEAKEDTERFFINYGNIDADEIYRAVELKVFDALPESLVTAGQKAYEVLVQTGSGQLCDMILDCAALEAIWQEGEKAKSTLLKTYAKIIVDTANVRTAVRCQKMNKDKEFMELAIANAGTIEKAELIEATNKELEDICHLLEKAGYAEGALALKNSMHAFECWCDNAVIEMIRPEQKNYFGIEPIVAFILGKENEARLVRLIISAKMNELDSIQLRERLRITYA